jgi:hypothetical protein
MNVNWLLNPCRRHQETLALLAADLCSPPDKLRVEEHLRSCAACRAHYQELTAVTSRIFRLKTETPLVGPGDALRARWTCQILGGEPSSERAQPAAGEGLFSLRRPWLGWGLAAAACVLLTFGLGYWHDRPALNDPLANRDVMRETLAMFPHRVRAIVEDDHGLNLILSDTADVPASTPLYIRVTDGLHNSSYLTFSGQEITLAGQRVTVLSDPRGGVILAGDHFVWSGTGRVSAGRLKIQARTLGPAAM